jgi:hypothetical protein
MKLRAPYRKRILHFCEMNDVTMPTDFDAPKSSDKYALVDLSTSPPTLVNRTTYLKSELADFLSRPVNPGRKFRLLDFKRGLELSCSNEGKFEKMSSFEYISPGSGSPQTARTSRHPWRANPWDRTPRIGKKKGECCQIYSEMIKSHFYAW